MTNTEYKQWRKRAEFDKSLWFAINAEQVKAMLKDEYGVTGFEKENIGWEVSIESKIRFVVERFLKQRGFKIDADRKWSYDGDISDYIPYFQDFRIENMYPVVATEQAMIYVDRDKVNYVKVPIIKYI